MTVSATPPASAPSSDHASIRQQVRRAIWLDRTPNMHFLGAFLQIAGGAQSETDAHCSIANSPALRDAGGEIDVGACMVLADTCLSMSFRKYRDVGSRVATVSLGIDLTGAPRTGRIEAAATMHGFMQGTTSRVGRADVQLSNEHGVVGYGTGTFMVLPVPNGSSMPSVPPKRLQDYEAPVPDFELEGHELGINARAEAALANANDSKRFLANFWDFAPVVTPEGARADVSVGPHLGNRVGHVHGGVLSGLATHTAQMALGEGWVVARLSASFLAAGLGPTITAVARVVHRGNSSAVVHILLSTAAGRPIMDVVTTFFKRAD